MHKGTIIGGLLFSGLYLLSRSGRAGHWPFWEYYSYLADLACIPVLLSAFYLIHFSLIRADRKFRLSSLSVAVAFTSLSLVFEWWLPSGNELYTADPLDVVMYFTGSLIFLGYHHGFVPKRKDRHVPA